MFVLDLGTRLVLFTATTVATLDSGGDERVDEDAGSRTGEQKEWMARPLFIV